ncbi:unnamed protein product [Oppiella nova]|uniref:PID domain-containing protein n=1 Tax=Oppiella nova TaxID=334625 RepID=A0A7R9LZK4_9ACAR|nr:unnamed protein product [Oppiella nova]CAG2168505.1 unnamed protein product [Oppiella nova]
MANEFTVNAINSNSNTNHSINLNTSDEISDQLIEKLFPKCRPKTTRTHELNDLNENYSLRNRNKHILIDLDLDVINDNTMNESKHRDKDGVQTDNNCIKSSLTNIGFKLDQLLLSPEEEYKPLNYNFINKPLLNSNEDIDGEEHSVGKDLTLRESRIEIAGGREIFSASKNKMNKRRLLSHNYGSCEDKGSQSVMKCKRNNTTQTRVNHDNHIINNDISLESDSLVNSSTNQSSVGDINTDFNKSVEHKHRLLSGIVVYEDFSTKVDSEIIYDDIEEMDKRELQLSVKPIASEMHDSDNNSLNCVNESSLNGDSIDKSDDKANSFESNEESEDNKEDSASRDQLAVAEGSKEIARIIGNVPIAQYDGSPRRYGPKPPGYPQRVINNEDMSVGLANSAIESKGLVDISCDELVKSILSIPTQYEDSPTNSCTNVSNGSKSHSSGIQSAAISEHESDKNDVIMETSDMNVYQFSDLDYKLYRMDSVGNSYVGKRLATLSSANSEDDTSVAVSPSKSVNNDSNSMIAHENELILLHERVRQHILSEMVSVDRSSVSTGADTEPEPEVCHRPQESNRNFTLSPDITDCDSNEIESELSLEGSLLSNSKIVIMPVLEDGLSSGVPSSDNELEEEVNCESPTTKRQICERLEEELMAKLKAKLKRNDNLLEHQIGYILIHDPSVLIEGVLFRARYLGSTQLVCEGQPTKATRMMQAEEAVSRIKVSILSLHIPPYY